MSKSPDAQQGIPIRKRVGSGEWLIIIFCLALFAVVVHLFFQYAGSAPYLATDDSVSNISHNLALNGRYGFLASPVEPITLSLRIDNFFNYGPWYFYIGAALSWLFGTSLEVQRAIHPLGLMVVVLAAYFTFRRFSVAASGIVAIVLMHLFIYAQWPMVRPDIMVALFGALTISLSSLALLTGRNGWWMASAFAAMAAITQHQISGAIGLCLIVIWAIGSYAGKRLDGETSGSPIGSFVACAFGSAVAAFIYLLMIDFRFVDLIGLFSGYAASAADADAQGGYFAVLVKHYDMTWAGVTPWVRRTILTGFIQAAVLLAMVRYQSRSAQRVVLALLLPPVLISLSYQFSLGFYGNWHQGYTLLTQVTTVWAGAAFVAVLIYLFRELSPFKAFPERALGMLVLVGIPFEIYIIMTQPSAVQKDAGKWVDFSEYVDHILAPLPPRARAWGTIQYGMETGRRVDLVQTYEGLELIRYFPPESRKFLAPDFLVYGASELRLSSVSAILNSDMKHRFYRDVAEYFPQSSYQLVSLVEAAPYGTTRIYRRIDGADDGAFTMPSVDVNDGKSRQWSSVLMPELPVIFKQEAPLVMEFPLADARREFSTADGTLVGELEAATYLFKVRVGHKNAKGGGTLVATSRAHVISRYDGISDGLTHAPYFASERNVSLLFKHQGGPVYISQFSRDQDANFEIVSVNPVRVHESKRISVPIPSLDRWRAGDDSIKLISTDGEAAEVFGNDTLWNYQYLSPPTKVNPNSNFSLILPVQVDTGNLAIGILDGQGNWLAAPVATGQTIEFHSGKWETIRIVITNNNRRGKTRVASRFRVGKGRLVRGLVTNRLTYADDASICHFSRKMEAPELCL